MLRNARGGCEVYGSAWFNIIKVYSPMLLALLGDGEVSDFQ